MSEERRARAREILQSALGKKPNERTRFLREACQSDPTLIPEVEQLLDSYERVSQRLKASQSERSSDDSSGDPPGSSRAQPSQIGKYQVLERVGQGAMGIVYKARDPMMRRLVGIKTISSDIASDKDLHDRFYREAISAGTLSHKNIITIYELGEEGGHPFIAMEFLVGEDLKSKLDRSAKLTLEQRLQWMIEMCEGLAHAHEKDIIHRDIKPGNVFITREGEVKILDFGLARLMSSVATKTGSVMGTPSYMSPEQVRGEKVDHRSDLFSAGATFYELLAFKKPFTGESIHGVFFQILEKMPPPLSEVNPWIPKELEAVVTRAIAKDVGERYESAAEILADLRRIESSLPEKRNRLRREALAAIGEVEPLLARYRMLLDREGISAAEAEQETLVLSPDLLNVDPSGAPTVTEELPADYVGLATTISRALDQKERLRNEIDKLETAGRLMKEAADLVDGKDAAAALERADAVLRDVPEHPRASALVDRLSSELAARDPQWKEKRVGELLSRAQSLFEDEQLDRCHERIERARSLDPDKSEVAILSERVEHHIARRRRERQHQQRADELVREARAKLVKDGDARACLTLLSEALSLQPEHSEGRVLWERAQTQLHKELALAAADTAAAAVASATQAMKGGDLALAARELSRAEKEFPEHTEIPAIATQLEQAKRTRVETLLDRSRAALSREDYEACLHEATELLKLDPTHREATALLRDARKAARERRPAPVAESGGRRRGVVLAITGSVVAAAVAGVVAWRALQSGELDSTPPGSVETTSIVSPPPVSVAPPASPTSVAPPTTLVSTTSVPAPTSTTTIAPTTSVSTTTTSVSTTTVPTTTMSPTTTSVASTTVAPTLAPREQILALMQQYETAYESLDVDLLGSLYPSVPLAVKNSFQHFDSLSLEMEPIEGPTVDRSTAGRTAIAVYRIVQTIDPKVGKETTSRHRATFQFAGVGNAWIIVGVKWDAE